MNNPLKKQIFGSKIVAFNVLDYFLPRYSWAWGAY